VHGAVIADSLRLIKPPPPPSPGIPGEGEEGSRRICHAPPSCSPSKKNSSPSHALWYNSAAVGLSLSLPSV
jgi:hypothetical protein